MLFDVRLDSPLSPPVARCFSVPPYVRVFTALALSMMTRPSITLMTCVLVTNINIDVAMVPLPVICLYLISKTKTQRYMLSLMADILRATRNICAYVVRKQ